MKKEKIIDDPLYQQLYPSGSRPGVLYGLPKVHKKGVPMRPILSSIGTCGYNIAKFLVPFLQLLTINDYTIKDSFSFVEEITSLTTNSHITMASFNIKSLFTNVPLCETIDIVADALYDVLDMPVLSLNKNFFKTLLKLSVRDVLFFFNNVLYSQINGVGMGNPLGLTLANAFL